MKTTLVFVYGTLKKGYANNTLLQTEYAREKSDPGFYTRFKGRGSVRNFTTVNAPSFPWAIEALGYHLRGEVYEVGPRVLYWLDRLEGFTEEGWPTIYDKKFVQVALDNGEAVDAIIYYTYPELYPEIPRLTAKYGTTDDWR